MENRRLLRLTHKTIDEQVGRGSAGTYALGFVVEGAFLAECERYHELGGSSGLDNERHPAPPQGADCACPAHVHHHG